MKKIVLTAAVFALTLSTAFSQEFKPKEKEIAIGVGLDSPFSSAKPFSLVNGISARYFYKSDLAIRANFNIDRDSKADYDYDDAGAETGSKISNTMKLNLAIGAEKHFAGTDRLDPYAGADILVGLTSINSETKLGTISGSSKRSDSNFGLRLLAGADYYVLPKVYIGTEFGITFNSFSMGNETSSVGTVTETKKYDDEYTQSSIKTTIGAAGAIRVGFRF